MHGQAGRCADPAANRAAGQSVAAARALDISPAVASAALKRLEHELGTHLLVRSTRSLRLTADGERYLAHARVALDALQAGAQALAAGRQTLQGSSACPCPPILAGNCCALAG
jgi:DNA-binding transcriptional LysR family regulator